MEKATLKVMVLKAPNERMVLTVLTRLEGRMAMKGLKEAKAVMPQVGRGALAARTVKETRLIQLRMVFVTLLETKQPKTTELASASNSEVVMKPAATQKAEVGSPRAITPR